MVQAPVSGHLSLILLVAAFDNHSRKRPALDGDTFAASRIYVIVCCHLLYPWRGFGGRGRWWELDAGSGESVDQNAKERGGGSEGSGGINRLRKYLSMACGRQISFRCSVGRLAVNFNHAINICILIYSFTSWLKGSLII